MTCMSVRGRSSNSTNRSRSLRGLCSPRTYEPNTPSVHAARAGEPEGCGVSLRVTDGVALSWPSMSSIRPRHAEDMLPDIGQDEVVVHRRGLVQTRLAELALDV